MVRLCFRLGYVVLRLGYVMVRLCFVVLIRVQCLKFYAVPKYFETECLCFILRVAHCLRAPRFPPSITRGWCVSGHSDRL